MTAIKGCAFLCDDNGEIYNVLRDDFGLVRQEQNTSLFTALFAPDSRRKSLDLMQEARQNNIAFDYRLDVFVGEKFKSLYFLAVHLSDKMLLIGADNHKEALNFTNHLQEINNEQSNYIRSLLKEKLEGESKKEQETEELFGELTRVNNELVNLQRELSKKNAELARLNDLKNKFMGMAAHDLRNPLGIIMNYADFIRDEAAGKISEEHMEFIDTIYDTSGYMLKLVEDLLDYSKIESGKLELNLEEVDLLTLVHKNIKLLGGKASQKGIAILLESQLDALHLKIDIAKIEQVLHNLLTNAIKFSHEGGEVKVGLKCEAEHCVLSVSDRGIGIPEEIRGELFTAFQEQSQKGTKGEKSNGLGLFIVKRIIEGHKGEIWFDSETNHGTTFFIRIPKTINIE